VCIGLRPSERPLELVAATALALPLLMGLYLYGRQKWFAAVLTAALAFSSIAPPFTGDVLYTGRGYFGVHRVIANRDEDQVVYHHLLHGGTVHGRQARTPERMCEPLTYYHPTGPLGDIFTGREQHAPPRRVSIVGLGSGAMACFARGGSQFTFYEIDPLVRDIAQTSAYFSYLDRCSSGGHSIVLGDGRMALERAPAASYDLMIFDAFSSDAVPVHLLTREALRVYLDKLADGGWLVFHASNTYLDLEAVLARLAADADLACLSCRDLDVSPEQFRAGKTPSTYVVMARKRADLAALAEIARWQEPRVDPENAVWTDDFSNLIEVLKW
jgi:hypothetical protein